MSMPSSLWLRSSASHPYFEKIERVLDQEIAFEADLYKSANLTAVHSILFTIFLVFADQYWTSLASVPTGWLYGHLRLFDYAIARGVPVLAGVTFLLAGVNALQLQLSEATNRLGGVRILRTDIAARLASHPIEPTPSAGEAEFGQLLLTLRMIEDKMRILINYRTINPRRGQAHLRATSCCT